MRPSHGSSTPALLLAAVLVSVLIQAAVAEPPPWAHKNITKLYPKHNVTTHNVTGGRRLMGSQNFTMGPPGNLTKIKCWKQPNGTAICKARGITYIWNGTALKKTGGPGPGTGGSRRLMEAPHHHGGSRQLNGDSTEKHPILKKKLKLYKAIWDKKIKAYKAFKAHKSKRKAPPPPPPSDSGTPPPKYTHPLIKKKLYWYKKLKDAKGGR